MIDYKDAIAEYEQARQEVAAIGKQRGELLFKCEKRGIWNEVDPPRNHCLAECYDLVAKESCGPSDYLDYHEQLQDGVADGEYCQNCLDSYNLKVGPLAKAKERFGKAKRRLSWAGKRILKEMADGNG